MKNYFRYIKFYFISIFDDILNLVFALFGSYPRFDFCYRYFDKSMSNLSDELRLLERQANLEYTKMRVFETLEKSLEEENGKDV